MDRTEVKMSRRKQSNPKSLKRPFTELLIELAKSLNLPEDLSLKPRKPVCNYSFDYGIKDERIANGSSTVVAVVDKSDDELKPKQLINFRSKDHINSQDKPADEYGLKESSSLKDSRTKEYFAVDQTNSTNNETADRKPYNGEFKNETNCKYNECNQSATRLDKDSNSNGIEKESNQDDLNNNTNKCDQNCCALFSIYSVRKLIKGHRFGPYLIHKLVCTDDLDESTSKDSNDKENQFNKIDFYQIQEPTGFWLKILRTSSKPTAQLQIQAGDCCPPTNEPTDSRGHRTDDASTHTTQNASFIPNSTLPTNTSQTARSPALVNVHSNLSSKISVNISNEPNMYSNRTSKSDIQTNLDHLNELNKNNLIYTDQYVVQLIGGPELAKELTERHGFVYLGQIFDDHYHLKHRRLAKRSLEPAHHEYHVSLLNEPNVNYVKQQTLKKRVKRDFVPISPYTLHSKFKTNNRFNDPQWPQMWYLMDRGLDMNVQKVWNQNITGKGIVVTILDDGLEKDHPDLAQNYDEEASFDVNNLDPDPQPRYDMLDSNRHGTRCAGEVAAQANNQFCGVGIAYDSKIGGVRMLDGDVTDAVEARSLSLANQHIHIYSASWGPDDNGNTVDGPGELATRAFVEGVTKGRGGLGSIFIWASGNGGREHDNCNCDGYTNSIWTLSISSATENGLVPWYSEACSSTLATTYSSGAYGEKQIITTDLHHRCTNSHTGTSASAPLAAGIAALTLQANPRLTWRDLQHIVVLTANPGNLKANDWRVNGVGRNVSHSFGYGLMDAQAMVALAREWITVPPQKICETRSNPINKSIPSKSYVELSLEVHCDKVKYLEHVQAKINLTTNRRGEIHIYLVSPSGTKSTLVAERPMDYSRAGFVNWAFMSVFYWGESPEGKWKLEVYNEGKYENRANLKEWTLIMYGTSEKSDRRRKLNSTLNSRNMFTSEIVQNLNKNEGHRLGSGGRLDNALNEMKLNSLNKTKSNSMLKPPIVHKSNELFNSGIFDTVKNMNKTSSNGHQSNVFTNDLGIFTQPDNIESIHTANHQPTDQEPFGTNDIDKSTRAEKSGNERTKPIIGNQSKDHLSRLGNRISNNLQQPQDLIKSDGRSGTSGEYEHQVENGSSQNRIAYEGCSQNNSFYFSGYCVRHCPDNYYGTELLANFDSLNTPVVNPIPVSNNDLTVSNLPSKDLKEQSNEFREQINFDHVSTFNNTTSSILSINKESVSYSNESLSTISPSTTSSSYVSNDQIHFVERPYISHNSIKQKDLNKHILLKQQEMAEAKKNSEINFINQVVKKSEQYEDNSQHEFGSDAKLMGDERVERISICVKCHYTCKTCTGGAKTQCTSCYPDSQLHVSGRCLFKDIAQIINKYRSTGDPMNLSNRQLFWIVIISLIMCLFFSLAFFYLLLCRRDCQHRPYTDQYSTVDQSTQFEYYQQVKLPIEIAHSESYNLNLYNETNHEHSSPSLLESALCALSFKRSCNEQKVQHTPLPNCAKYSNSPVRFEMNSNNRISEVNECEEIT